MSAITPGPWRVGHYQVSVGPGFNGIAVTVLGPNNENVSGTIHHATYVTRYGDPNKRYTPFPHYSGDEPVPASANAHLIAAAPDLYEALKATVAALASSGSMHQKALDAAEAALAKARGETP